MNILIDNKSGAPIYDQIYSQIKSQIISSELKEDEMLPSIRGLAKELRISVITTMKAYEELEKQGLVTAVQGKGYYVNAQDSEMLKEQHLRKMEEHLINAIFAARIANISDEELKQALEMLLLESEV